MIDANLIDKVNIQNLISALREYSGCRKGEIARITSDAAAAIEELEDALADECSENDYLVNENARLTTENNELQAELAGSKDAIRILKHNLEMKMPKRGEWIRVQEVDIPGEMHTVALKCMCSTCRNEYIFPRIPQYCPDCGSRNTAKMEVQDGSSR